MKKKLTLIALTACIITGCKVNQSCEAYSQCDELYMNDYNCEYPNRLSYSPRSYPNYISNSYTPGYNAYYPNTQTVYYSNYNIYNCPPTENNNNNNVISQPRPNTFGTYTRPSRPNERPTSDKAPKKRD